MATAPTSAPNAVVPPEAASAVGLSVIVPCYNPPAGWAEEIIYAYKQLEAWGPEIILVNDGSSSDLEDGVALLHTTLPRFRYEALPANAGKGAAVRRGLALATAPMMLYTDVDMPYTIDSMQAVLATLCRADCDIAVGIKDAAYYSKVPYGRRAVSKTLRRLIAILLRMSVDDTQCGLKGVKRSAVGYFLEGVVDRYLFDLEALYRAERGGARLVAVPVTLRPGVVFSPVRLKLLVDETRNFLRILWRKRGA